MRHLGEARKPRGLATGVADTPAQQPGTLGVATLKGLCYFLVCLLSLLS